MQPQLVFVSIIAGMLTIFAPCIFPLLPVLLGASVGSRQRHKATRIIISLLASVLIISLLLYALTSVFPIQQSLLRAISGLLLLFIGTTMLFPDLWEKVTARTLSQSSNGLLAKAMKNDSAFGDYLVGAALGPVFSSCSPTYGIIVATILPVSVFDGLFYLVCYLIGLGVVFSLIAIAGSVITKRFSWIANPHGWIKRIVGIIIIFIGILVLFNIDKLFEAWLLNNDFYESLTRFELDLQR